MENNIQYNVKDLTHNSFNNYFAISISDFDGVDPYGDLLLGNNLYSVKSLYKYNDLIQLINDIFTEDTIIAIKYQTHQSFEKTKTIILNLHIIDINGKEHIINDSLNLGNLSIPYIDIKYPIIGYLNKVINDSSINNSIEVNESLKAILNDVKAKSLSNKLPIYSLDNITNVNISEINTRLNPYVTYNQKPSLLNPRLINCMIFLLVTFLYVINLYLEIISLFISSIILLLASFLLRIKDWFDNKKQALKSIDGFKRFILIHLLNKDPLINFIHPINEVELSIIYELLKKVNKYNSICTIQQIYYDPSKRDYISSISIKINDLTKLKAVINSERKISFSFL